LETKDTSEFSGQKGYLLQSASRFKAQGTDKKGRHEQKAPGAAPANRKYKRK
jgi:hypothetical protein